MRNIFFIFSLLLITTLQHAADKFTAALPINGLALGSHAISYQGDKRYVIINFDDINGSFEHANKTYMPERKLVSHDETTTFTYEHKDWTDLPESIHLSPANSTITITSGDGIFEYNTQTKKLKVLKIYSDRCC